MGNLAHTLVSETTVLNRTSLSAGIFTGLGLIVFFLIMWFFNLHEHLELHYLNIIVLFFGLRYAIKKIRSISGEIRYFEGLKAGVIVSVISVVVFNVFMLVYATLINPSFLDFMESKINLGVFTSINETMIDIMGLIIVEGLSSGFILTFILMQYYKSESSETI